MRHSTNYRNNSQSSILMTIFNNRFVFPLILVVWFVYFTFAHSSQPKALRGSGDSKFKLDLDNIKRKNVPYDHLVVVAGHAVMRMSKLSVAAKSDDGWYLLPYQRNQGFPSIISSHIRKGIELTKNDDSAMLVFSGGQTRKDVGPTSEGASYYYLAQQNAWMNELEHRIYLEEYARDSFENLLFSVCRFREVTGYYPSQISVVGFDFKGKRFSDLHRKAIGYPASNFTYVGLKSSSKFDQKKAIQGEALAMKSFSNDMYGCNDPSLADKRNIRNPFRRTVPYELACPEMKELLHWCGPTLFKELESLPWSQQII